MLFAQQCLGLSWPSAEGHEPEKQQHCRSEKKLVASLPSPSHLQAARGRETGNRENEA